MICSCSPAAVFTQISLSCVDDDQFKLGAQTGCSAHEQYEWWYLTGCVSHPVTACGAFSLAISWFGRPVGQNYSVPDGGCPERAWWHHVSPCFLSCHALYNPQEEDLVPPRPPLPQSYVPNPPTVPPLPSHAGVRPSSLHRPEDRKAHHRNGTHSVSLVTRWPHGRPRPQLCHQTSLLAVMVFT